MANLRYESPKTALDAVALLENESGRAKVFAGGTDLIVQMQEGHLEPSLLVDIKQIPETRKIIFGSDNIRIGSAVTGAEIGEDQKLREMWPGVVEAAELIGSYQIQGRATIGGNLCNASPAADSVPALIAAGAKVAIMGPLGERETPIEKLLSGPGKTFLKKGEFVTTIILPLQKKAASDAYLRFIPRTEMDIAVVGAGVSLAVGSDGVCSGARLSLGAISPTALLVEKATDILVGNRLDSSVLSALSKAASDICQPIDDKRGTIEFRTKVAGVLACRAAKIAGQRAEER